MATQNSLIRCCPYLSLCNAFFVKSNDLFPSPPDRQASTSVISKYSRLRHLRSCQRSQRVPHKETLPPYAPPNGLLSWRLCIRTERDCSGRTNTDVGIKNAQTSGVRSLFGRPVWGWNKVIFLYLWPHNTSRLTCFECKNTHTKIICQVFSAKNGYS